jgi:hypothetical protein
MPVTANEQRTRRKKPPSPIDASYVEGLRNRRWFRPAYKMARYMLSQDANKQYEFIPLKRLFRVSKIEEMDPSIDLRDPRFRSAFDLANQMLIYGWRREMHNAYGIGYVLCHLPEQHIIEIIKSHLRGFAHMKKSWQRFGRNEVQLLSSKPETAVIAAQMGTMQSLIVPVMEGVSNQLKVFLNQLKQLLDPATSLVAGLITDPTKHEGDLPEVVKRVLLKTASAARRLKAVKDPPKQLPEPKKK